MKIGCFNYVGVVVLDIEVVKQIYVEFYGVIDVIEIKDFL